MKGQDRREHRTPWEESALHAARLKLIKGDEEGALQSLQEAALRERVQLVRAAMLAREGNTAGALQVLLQAADDFIGEQPKSAGPRRAGREPDGMTNPLYMPLSDLGLDTRVLGFLEQGLNAYHVIDLDKWTPEQIKAIPNLGPKGYQQLIDALKRAGVLEALAERKRVYEGKILRDIGEKIPVDAEDEPA